MEGTEPIIKFEVMNPDFKSGVSHWVRAPDYFADPLRKGAAKWRKAGLLLSSIQDAVCV